MVAQASFTGMVTTPAAVSASEVADIEAVLVVLGLLAVGALVVAVAVPRTRPAVVASMAGTGTLLAAGIALLATGGSLWFSEGAGFPPCELCWYQRIAMYPLVVVLGIAGFRDSATGRLTGTVIAVLGLAVSSWHIVVEATPDSGGGGCDPDNPCTIRWVEGLGFWTIPRLAAGCFVIIIVLVLLDHFALRHRKDPS